MRYVFWIGGGILLFFVVTWVVAFVMISLRKDTISEMAIAQINKQVKGTVVIGDLAPNFFRAFPNISVLLSDVTIRDSLWNAHHHDFLNAKKIYISLQLLSLITGKPKIGKVIVEDASIYLYTDECGYCNLNPTERVSFSKGKSDIPDIRFIHTRFVIENQFLNSYHDIEAAYIDCASDSRDKMYVMHFEMNTLVHGVGFNLAKGSYLREKKLDGKFHVFYYPSKKISFDNIELDIDHHPFAMSGNIFLHAKPIKYELTINTGSINYEKASGLLNDSLRHRVEAYTIDQPIDIAATLDGIMALRAVPKVVVLVDVNHVGMTTRFAELTDCSFKGSFDNQVDSVLLPGDVNSKFTIRAVSAEWSGIPITSPLIEIENLLNPNLKCHLQSKFTLETLNELMESSTISFSGGNGELDVQYNGSIGTIDTVYPAITGFFSMEDAEFRYVPRDLLFQHGNGRLEFLNEDIIINNLSATAGNTHLMMTGKFIHLLALVNKELAQPLMDLHISTPDLNLNDFISYIKPRVQINRAKKTRQNILIKATERIDHFLRDGIAQLHIDAGKVTYKKFVATDVSASIKLIENKVLIDDGVMHHADGKLLLKGSLVNGNQSNQLTLTSTIEQVNIPGLFRSFDNFGQDGITYETMKGRLSATIQMTGVITDKAVVAENSMKGTVDFNIQQGELIDFEPALKIAATAFKKRDFSHIEFGELTSRLSINGSEIRLDKMEIRSNVIVLFAEGIYDTKKGTDMSIQVPLSNLSKAENDINNTGKVGANIRLRAKTGDDGKLGISWDPFNKASKGRKAEADLGRESGDVKKEGREQ